MANGHILIFILSGQGAINPSIQFAKHLARMGLKVTILISLYVQRLTSKTLPIMEGLKVATFSDGYDDGFKQGDDHRHFMSELQRQGSKAISELIKSSAKEGQPITRVVYTMALPWAAKVADEFNIPSTVLWIQPAMIFEIFYYYFNGYGDAITKCCHTSPSDSIELPGLPSLTSNDLPTFLIPSNPFNFVLPFVKEQLEVLNAEAHSNVLVNTFHALELRSLEATAKFNLVPIGPLVPSVLLNEKDPSDTSYGMDLFQNSKEYFDWLNSKPKSSVVYVSFGSIAITSKQQMEEIAVGLLKCQRPFLWVIRDSGNWEKEKGNPIRCIEELEQQGLIVQWCSQVEVLSHPSLGCFFSHCGWNSSLESIVSGVPVVGYPHSADQPINAKLLEDVFKTGVRVKRSGEGMVTGDEIARCIELVMGDGERGKEMRRNAKRWKDLAREAMKEGGSSHLNLKAFVNENMQLPSE